jgi:hypothetical protein
MKTLETVQNDFYKAIFQKKSNHADFVSSSHPSERLAIYKHTIFETLRNALAITYPGIWALLGEECSSNIANAFCSLNENLPSSGCLDDWGDQFPDFINQQSVLSNLYSLFLKPILNQSNSLFYHQCLLFLRNLLWKILKPLSKRVR